MASLDYSSGGTENIEIRKYKKQDMPVQNKCLQIHITDQRVRSEAVSQHHSLAKSIKFVIIFA